MLASPIVVLTTPGSLVLALAMIAVAPLDTDGSLSPDMFYISLVCVWLIVVVTTTAFPAIFRSTCLTNYHRSGVQPWTYAMSHCSLSPPNQPVG